VAERQEVVVLRLKAAARRVPASELSALQAGPELEPLPHRRFSFAFEPTVIQLCPQAEIPGRRY
jgi:hypothetical protein